jgi:hypothetical protein
LKDRPTAISAAALHIVLQNTPWKELIDIKKIAVAFQISVSTIKKRQK